MRRSFFLVIIFVIITGIQPALAQSTQTLDLGLASDDELTEALEKADDIELINKDDDVIGATTGAASSGQKAGGAGTTGGNEYLDESRRLVMLAEEAFSEADYDKSAMLADEAASLADLAAQSRKGAGTSGVSSPNALPATYTVRNWSVSKDCFWNIAGFPWVYGNPYQWRTLYNANKSKLPNPNNPNVIEPGTVLDIPSIKGEVRQGAWESGRTYEPL
jgi:nucleoid-associated protein YgaU